MYNGTKLITLLTLFKLGESKTGTDDEINVIKGQVSIKNVATNYLIIPRRATSLFRCGNVCIYCYYYGDKLYWDSFEPRQHMAMMSDAHYTIDYPKIYYHAIDTEIEVDNGESVIKMSDFMSGGCYHCLILTNNNLRLLNWFEDDLIDVLYPDDTTVSVSDVVNIFHNVFMTTSNVYYIDSEFKTNKLDLESHIAEKLFSEDIDIVDAMIDDVNKSLIVIYETKDGKWGYIDSKTNTDKTVNDTIRNVNILSHNGIHPYITCTNGFYTINNNNIVKYELMLNDKVLKGFNFSSWGSGTVLDNQGIVYNITTQGID